MVEYLYMARKLIALHRETLKKSFTVFATFVVSVFFLFGCDTNILGGSSSSIDTYYEPGKRTPSAPPTISPIADFTMDENDIQSVPFVINDIDTFLMCSNIFVKATSSNGTLIDYTGFTVTGVYPNCVLRMQPKAMQYGVTTVKVELFDFWTVVSSSFQLTVQHVLTPGLFTINEAQAQDRAVLLEWSNAAYMTGSSARYTVFYRPTGSAAPYSQITPTTSPYLVSGLVNGTSYDFFVRARNSIGYRDSNVVSAIPTRFKLYGAELVPGSTQDETSAGAKPTRVFASSGDKTDEVFQATTPSGKYRVYMNSQGNIISGVNP